jgi:hypothetical protein
MPFRGQPFAGFHSGWPIALTQPAAIGGDPLLYNRAFPRDPSTQGAGFDKTRNRSKGGNHDRH